MIGVHTITIVLHEYIEFTKSESNDFCCCEN